MTVINARQVLNRDGRLIVTVPETVEASADDLAGAPRLLLGIERQQEDRHDAERAGAYS